MLPPVRSADPLRGAGLGKGGKLGGEVESGDQL